MFARTMSLFETIPENKGIVSKIRFFFMKRRIEKVAKDYNQILGLEFYSGLSLWTGKDAVIVFSQKDDDPVKVKVESKDDHFARMFARAKSIGVASAHLD